MRWKYLFFDLDGTLTDPMPGITRSVQYALRHFGIEADDPTALCPFIGPPLRNSFREFYDMSDADAEVAVEKYREYYAPKGIFENRLYEGIPELLRDLRAHGATLVVATSKPTRFAEQIARHFGFADDFALISGSTPDGSRDAKADVIRHALATLGIDDPDRAVMIGDRRRRRSRNGACRHRRTVGLRQPRRASDRKTRIYCGRYSRPAAVASGIGADRSRSRRPTPNA